MLINVFISHKKEDSNHAKEIANYLRYFDEVSCYLDILDPVLNSFEGDDLGEYFREKLGGCTHLMAILSDETKESWWVPFEIGIATEKQYPIVTFAVEDVNLPLFLKKWPYLRKLDDLQQYFDVAYGTQRHILMEGLEKIASSRRGLYARAFHKNLKEALGQVSVYRHL